jgi:tetratricopeptide (TPR) repeat protein
MSSARPTEPTPSADLSLELALLCDALDLNPRGAFLFAVCEEGPLRERLMRHMREYVETEAEGSRGLLETELSREQPDLAGRLEQRLLYEPAQETPIPAAPSLVRDRSRAHVVFVRFHGLAAPDDEDATRALRALNFQRERISRLNVPLVFWLSQSTLGQVTQHAADVFAARSGLFFFEAPMREPGTPSPMHAEATVSMLDQFHRTLLPPDELRRRASLYEKRLKREQAAGETNWPRVTSLCRDLANIYHELDDYARWGEFQDQAIAAYHKAIATRDQEAGEQRQEWASLQGWLDNQYADRMRGDRTENLQRAIACYEQALRFRTPEAAPLDYAMTQNNLGNAYSELPTGDRGQNLEKAIACLNTASSILTAEAFPYYHEIVKRNLARAQAESALFASP